MIINNELLHTTIPRIFTALFFVILADAHQSYAQAKGTDCIDYEELKLDKNKAKQIPDYKPRTLKKRNIVSNNFPTKERFCYIPLAVDINKLGLIEIRTTNHAGAYFIFNSKSKITELSVIFKSHSNDFDSRKTKKKWLATLHKFSKELDSDTILKIKMAYDDILNTRDE